MKTKAAPAFLLRWDIQPPDARLIEEIVDRAVNMRAYRLAVDGVVNRLELTMDLTAVHQNNTPLRLMDLLNAEAFDFLHDVAGIQKHIDRTSGQLRNHFLPRFAEHV